MRQRERERERWICKGGSSSLLVHDFQQEKWWTTPLFCTHTVTSSHPTVCSLLWGIELIHFSAFPPSAAVIQYWSTTILLLFHHQHLLLSYYCHLTLTLLLPRLWWLHFSSWGGHWEWPDPYLGGATLCLQPWRCLLLSACTFPDLSLPIFNSLLFFFSKFQICAFNF